MRVLITYSSGNQWDSSASAMVVDDATPELVSRWFAARDSTPCEVLSIPNARVHADEDVAGTASLRAGRILDIREY